MRLTGYLKILQLLKRLDDPEGRHPAVGERPDLTSAGGMAYDLYEPRGRAGSTVLAVQGVTLQGRKEHRLVHFGRCLARSGVRCAVPTLPGMTSCRWLESDLDQLAGLIVELAGVTGQRVGLIGFSYGASFALVAGARPAVRPRVAWVISFGAYHRLADVLRWYAEDEAAGPATEKAWDDRIYLHLVLAWMRHHHRALPAHLAGPLEDLLSRYCTRASTEEKMRFERQHLRSLDLVPGALELLERTVDLEAFSPAGKLAGLPFEVSVLHDATDTMVPPDHAPRLHAELPHGRLLVTALLDHVGLADLVRVGEVRDLLKALAPAVL